MNSWDPSHSYMSSLFISQKFSSFISSDLEEILNRERIVNVISTIRFYIFIILQSSYLGK